MQNEGTGEDEEGKDEREMKRSGCGGVGGSSHGTKSREKTKYREKRRRSQGSGRTEDQIKRRRGRIGRPEQKEKERKAAGKLGNGEKKLGLGQAPFGIASRMPRWTNSGLVDLRFSTIV